MLRILGRETSINVRKVLWAADELGIAYEREDWGRPLRDPKEPEFLAINPNAQVPVIVDDGFVLWESGAIVRYLGAVRESPLWPIDARARALSDQWLTWQSTELNPPWHYAVYALLRHEPGYDDKAKIEQSLVAWGRKMKMLVGLSIHRWVAASGVASLGQQCAAYYAKLRQRPAGGRWMADEFF